jgi:hypothetical protein
VEKQISWICRCGEIPTVLLENGTAIRLICGKVGGQEGPAQGVAIDPEYLDVSVPAGTVFTHRVSPGHPFLVENSLSI